ncbi:MAG: hypothetical protein JWO59_1188 [Chloroflexi bacterium]|nr:hypothetical protein [Chloroflexota bacterium]
MSHDQQNDRLRRLRAARGDNATRLEPVRGGQQAGYSGSWPVANPIQSAPSSGHGGALIGLLLLVLIAGGAIGGVAYVLHKFHSSVGGPRKTVHFVVQKGEGVSAIANQLEKDGLVSNSTLFQLYYRFNGGSGGIQAGPHVLNSDMSLDKIAQVLQSPPPTVTVPVTLDNQYNILAGKRAEEVATILDKYHIAPYKDVMNEVLHGNYNYWFLKGRPAGASLEGFLAPGEYTLAPHSNAHSVVALMLRRFGQNFTPKMQAQASAAHRSIFEVVTIASIVQRESSLPKVQRFIAGVYYNRLVNTAVVDNRLNADPTVQYAMGYSQSEHTWWRQGLDLQIDNTFDSPYNTYRVRGLPPGPISNPGLSALAAALDPAPSNYLFFQSVAKPGARSRTYFCVTLDCQTNGTGVPVQ